MSTTDAYTALVNKPLGRRLARKLGLPRPAELRRYQPGQPLVTAPILVLGTGDSADSVARHLMLTGEDVRRDAGVKNSFAAVVVVCDELATPADLGHTVLQLSPVLRHLTPSARVVFVSRDPLDAHAGNNPAISAARQAVQGVVRSLAQELRAGATANGVLLGDDVSSDSAASMGALRFFLSGRSAYVNGQFLTVTRETGQLPADDTRPLDGKVAVVTGAARGIGRAIITALHRDGAQVIGLDVPAAGDQLATVMNRLGGTALQLDITSAQAGARIIGHAVQRFGSLDIVVHNAGITRDKLLANMDSQRWEAVQAVNINSQLTMNEAFLAARGEGGVSPQLRIATLASTSGIAGNRGQTNYAASKAAVMGLTRATAPLLAETGGTINAVAPGFIETEMTAKMPAATREVARRLNSLRQGGQPGDVAEAVAFLVSDAAAGINGTTLRVCGQAMMGA